MKINTNNRYLDKQSLLEKLSNQRKQLNSERKKNRRLKKRLQKQMVLLSETSHKDMCSLFAQTDKLGEDCVPEDMKTLWEVQRKSLKLKDKRGMRWHPR